MKEQYESEIVHDNRTEALSAGFSEGDLGLNGSPTAEARAKYNAERGTRRTEADFLGKKTVPLDKEKSEK
jgi:hypothetical protein